jgi:AAA family ATP:ADP antiporter
MKWRTASLLTPIMILVTGSAFYIFLIYRENNIMLSSIILTLGTTPLYLAIMLGGAQNILSTSTKYAFFDTTKEISYIPLDEELKTKGKAAADLIGGKLGDSTGAFIQWSILQIGYMFNSSISLIGLSAYFFMIFIMILVVWFIAAHYLNKEFHKKIESMHDSIAY